MFKKKNSTGMTLIEMMLSLTLSFFIISSVFEMYVIAENNKSLRMALIFIQENTEILRQLLKQRIQIKTKIQVYQDPESKPGTDSIRIWHTSIRSNILLQDMRGNSFLYLSKNFPIQIGESLIISDFITTEIFQVKHVFLMANGTQRIETMKPLSKLFQGNTEINKLEMDSYYIAKTERLDANKQPIYGLFTKDIHGIKSELVEGVSDMRIVSEPRGVAFSFVLIAINNPELYKKEYLYVALS